MNKITIGLLMIAFSVSFITAAIVFPASAPAGEWWGLLLFWSCVGGCCSIVAGLWE